MAASTRRALFEASGSDSIRTRSWRYVSGASPRIRHGVAAPMDVEIDIGFTLRNESINAQIANDMVSLVGPGVTPPQAVRW
jgi:hypothetical protein